MKLSLNFLSAIGVFFNVLISTAFGCARLTSVSEGQYVEELYLSLRNEGNHYKVYLARTSGPRLII